MKYAEIKKRCPHVLFEGLHPSNIEHWENFIKYHSRRLGTGSCAATILALPIFFKKALGYGPKDIIEIIDYNDCGPTFTCLINGKKSGVLTIEKNVYSDNRHVNEFAWQDENAHIQRFEVLAKELSPTVEKESPYDLKNSDVILTIRPLTVTLTKDNKAVEFKTRYLDETGYRTEITSRSTGTLDSVSIDHYDSKNVLPLTLAQDAPYVLNKYNELGEYLLTLGENLSLQEIYTQICNISFGTDLSKIEDLKLRIYRTIMVEDSFTKFPHQCCADEIWLGKGKVDCFGFDGVTIYKGGKVDVCYGDSKLYNVDNDYILPHSTTINYWIDGIRKTVAKAAQMFPEESMDLLGLETGQEPGLLGDVWRENSQCGQLNMFNLMGDYPCDIPDCDYCDLPVSSDNKTQFGRPKQFVKTHASQTNQHCI